MQRTLVASLASIPSIHLMQTMHTLPQENSAQRLPLHLITGFLGSGKTTLLNHLLQQPGMENTAVIVNEFGEIGVDHLLVEASEEDIMMLAGGCLCCSVRSDLVTTLEDLYQRRARGAIKPFEQVVVETSGMADPAPILRTFLDDAFISAHFRLEGVVTTVDAVYGHQQLDDYDESVKQAALATQLVLTKTDLAATGTLAVLRQRLARMNPAAQQHDRQRDALDAPRLFASENRSDAAWLQADSYLRQPPALLPLNSHRAAPGKDAYIRSFCIEREQPLPWQVLERWIQHMTRLRGKDLLRVKGIAYTCETDLPVLIQGVQHIFQPPSTLPAWPAGRRRSQLVFITRNIEQSQLERSLDTLWQSRTPAEACQAALILLSSETTS